MGGGKNIILLVCCLISLIGVLLGIYNYNILMFVDSTMSAALYFSIGDYTKEYLDRIERKSSGISIIQLAIIILSILSLLYLVGPYINLRTNTFTIKGLLVSIPESLLGIGMMLLMCIKIHKNKLLEYIGKNSLLILVLHRWIYQFIDSLTNRLDFIEIRFVILYVGSIIICIVVSPIINRFCPTTVGKKVIN